MNLKEKIIAFDIDGTLARNDTFPSTFTYETIKRLIEEGYHICLVTGRSIVSSIDIYKRCNMNTLCVLCNGAMVYDPISDKKIRNIIIPMSIVESVINNRELMEMIDDILIEIDYQTYALTGNCWPKCNKIGNFKDTLPASPNAMVIMAKDPLLQNKIASIINKSEDYHYRYWNYMGEFYNLHFSKKEGVEAMLKYYNKDASSLIFFGDGENDRELLSYASMGIAMKNADDETKKYANVITDYSNEEDGAIKYLLKMIQEHD